MSKDSKKIILTNQPSSSSSSSLGTPLPINNRFTPLSPFSSRPRSSTPISVRPPYSSETRNDEHGRKPCTKRSPGLPEIEKRRKITKYWSIGSIAVRDGGIQNPPRYAMHERNLRSPDFFAVDRDFEKNAPRKNSMADRGEQYQLAPHDMRNGTPSSSSAPDSDSSEASTAASRAPSVVPQAQPALPHSPLEPRPVTPPPPALPIIPSPPHSPLADPFADRMQSISPPRVPVWDGLRRMRGQARKTTGLPPRKQLAPRDEFHATHEMGESSHQAELRAQLQQVTQNLQGTQQSLQQCQATVEDTRMTILQILTSHLTLMDQVKALDTDTRAWRTAIDDRLRMTWVQIMLAAFWRQVAWMTEGWSWVRERATEFLAWFGVASTETRMMILAVVMAIVAMILSFLSYFMR
ncbi:hypothetical protein E3N88_22268 [Mikania micrantha]|uniref:Uncharacterized protein n=1 Tax=Mikania micrantha TaxID=192012 RepID=A0A5N6NBL4_9ASTR|nr:hypothetical protein E3N88_22268 [Mikania micrantha]